jgi:serine/threonine-protein kinase
VVTISNTGVVTPVSTPGFTLSAPEAVAVDATGTLYIADFNNARILEVPGSTTLGSPISIAVDSVHGILYVGDQNTAAVYKLAGGVATKIAIANATNLFPQALAIDGSGGLYIADDNSNNVYELAYGGSSAQTVTPTGFALNSPSGLAWAEYRRSWPPVAQPRNQYTIRLAVSIQSPTHR